MDSEILNVGREIIFKPEHLAVDREIRKLLKRLIKIRRDSLEFHGEAFTGFVRFDVPKGDAFQASDILTICAEIEQAQLGSKATVELWLVQIVSPGVIEMRPAEFQLQEEDLEEPPPVSRRAFIDMVRPSQGWLILIVPSMLLWLCR